MLNPEIIMCGGYSQGKQANEGVQNLIEEVRTQVETRLNKNFSLYQAVTYTSQIVCGTNFTVKVKVGDDDYIHLQIFKALECYGGQSELSNVEENHTLDSQL
jgi:cystatin-A/B